MTAFSTGNGTTSNDGLGFAGRNLATGHPHIFYAVGAAEVLISVLGGAALMFMSVAAGIIVMAFGTAAGVMTAIPGYWSERHPDQAKTLAERRGDLDRERARKHPVYFLVVLPIIAAVSATLRWNSGNHTHRDVWSWTIPAVAGLALGAAIGGFLVIRARRAYRQRPAAKRGSYYATKPEPGASMFR